MAGNVNAPECLVSADDKSINNQSLVSIVKFLLYYHMSSAELKDRGRSLVAESAKGKWFLLGSDYYRGGSVCVDHLADHRPSMCSNYVNLFGTKDKKFWYSSQPHMSPLSMMGAKTVKGRG